MKLNIEEIFHNAAISKLREDLQAKKKRRITRGTKEKIALLRRFLKEDEVTDSQLRKAIQDFLQILQQNAKRLAYPKKHASVHAMSGGLPSLGKHH